MIQIKKRPLGFIHFKTIVVEESFKELVNINKSYKQIDIPENGIVYCIKILSSKIIIEMINSDFYEISSDFAGSIITTTRSMAIVELAFALDSKKEGIKSIKKISNSITYNKKNYKKKTVELTDKAKQILSEFIPVREKYYKYKNDDNTINWDLLYKEDSYLDDGKLKDYLLIPIDIKYFLAKAYGLKYDAIDIVQICKGFCNDIFKIGLAVPPNTPGLFENEQDFINTNIR